MKRLFCPVLDALLHSLGLNDKFPLVMLHSVPDNLGLGIDNLPSIHGVAQLHLLLGHVNMGDRTSKIIEINCNHLELIIGLGTCPLADPHSTSHNHML